MRKLIVFDAMGVVYTTCDDVSGLLIPYLKKINPDISDKAVQQLYHKLSLGIINSEEFFSEFGFSNKFPEIQSDYLESCLVLDENFVPLAEKLKEKYDLAMLSNDASEWSKHLRNRFCLDDYFDYYVISGDAGFRKPSEEIYKILLEKANTIPQECVFIDDNVKNIETAENLGFNTIWFNRNKERIGRYGYTVESLPEIYNITNSIFQT